jgi:hypothetical protein
MSVEKGVRDRINQLMQEGSSLSRGYGEQETTRDARHAAECIGWIRAAAHAVRSVCPSPQNTYHQTAVEFQAKPSSAYIHEHVGQLNEVLKHLLYDIDNGLLRSVANQARGETLDDLLDQAAEYFKREQKDGSGILAGAVFEDTLRRICRLNDKDVKTDALITTLNQREIISGVVAKRCRAAAGMRNRALHAQWDEFTLEDVAAVLSLTRELIATHLT